MEAGPVVGEPGGKPETPDRRLMREYGQKYIEVQRMILSGLPTEQTRLDWAGRYGAAFHELAGADPSFHELVVSAEPDIAEIKRRVEEYGDASDRQE